METLQVCASCGYKATFVGTDGLCIPCRKDEWTKNPRTCMTCGSINTDPLLVCECFDYEVDKQCTECGCTHSGVNPSCAACEEDYNRGAVLRYDMR